MAQVCRIPMNRNDVKISQISTPTIFKIFTSFKLQLKRLKSVKNMKIIQSFFERFQR